MSTSLWSLEMNEYRCACDGKRKDGSPCCKGKELGCYCDVDWERALNGPDHDPAYEAPGTWEDDRNPYNVCQRCGLSLFTDDMAAGSPVEYYPTAMVQGRLIFHCGDSGQHVRGERSGEANTG